MKSAIVELEIESLAYQGYGVGKKDGFVFFVEGTCPGDRIKAQVTQKKKNFGQAKITTLIESSKHREMPKCEYFPTCGGCHWQHVSYQEQLKQKAKILEHALHFKNPLVVAAPNPYGYRNRIRLHWDGHHLGMYQRKSNQILPINSCAIADPAISRLIPQTKEYLKIHSLNESKNIDLIVTESGLVERCITRPNEIKSPPFSQVNAEVNTLLKKFVVNNIPSTTSVVLDLYCGSGNFTFEVAKEFTLAKIFAVELCGPSIVQARANQKQKNLQNVEFFEQKVEQFLRNWIRPSGFLTVILDPPRSGCSPEVIDELIKIKPNTIIYVGCDPMTQYRDIQRLHSQSSGTYNLVSVTGFDMFPQTYHLESVAIINSAPNV